MKDDDCNYPDPEPGWREDDALAHDAQYLSFGERRAPGKTSGQRSVLNVATEPERKRALDWGTWWGLRTLEGAPDFDDVVIVNGERGEIVARWSSRWHHARGAMFDNGEVGLRIRHESGTEAIVYWPEDFRNGKASKGEKP